MLNNTTIIKFIIWNSSNITVWVLHKSIDKSIWKFLIPRKQKETTVNGFNGRGKTYRKNGLTLKTIDFISASSSSSNFFSCKVYIAQYLKIFKMMLEIKRQNPGFCFQYFITYISCQTVFMKAVLHVPFQRQFVAKLQALNQYSQLRVSTAEQTPTKLF